MKQLKDKKLRPGDFNDNLRNFTIVSEFSYTITFGITFFLKKKKKHLNKITEWISIRESNFDMRATDV